MGQETTDAVTQETTQSTSVADGEVQSQPLSRTFSMAGGEGQESYSKNSALQAHIVDKFILPDVKTALEFVTLPQHGPLIVADLGCSSGSNTISNISFIVDILRARFSDAALSQPDVHAFFNDLPSNDFNNLFQLLGCDPGISSGRNLFVAGVPGSFYGRLFPNSYVHVFFSSVAMHWLSKVPDAVLDKDSPAYNKSSIFSYALPVAIAYKEQASLDLKAFLNARAAELVPGGLLFLAFSGRADPEPNRPSSNAVKLALWETLDEAFNDLILQGVLTEEQRANINLPVYQRSRDEVQEALDSCADAFHIQTFKLHPFRVELSTVYGNRDTVTLSRKYAAMYRSVFNSLLEPHVGKEAREAYWEHFAKLVEQNVAHRIIVQDQDGDSYSSSWANVVGLIRK